MPVSFSSKLQMIALFYTGNQGLTTGLEIQTSRSWKKMKMEAGVHKTKTGVLGRNVIYSKLMLILAIVLPTIVSGTGQAGSIQEYCQEETLAARCSNTETILMTSARYGRMALGRCVKRDLGYIGCAAEALRFVDSRCSGHQQCEISIMDPELRSLKPCPKDVTWHLEASYDCIRVETKNRHECHKASRVQTEGTSGYLSSEVAMTTGVGSPTCPWQLVAPPGQTINITLYNFVYNSLTETDHAAKNSPCVIIARLHEEDVPSTKSISACSSDPRTGFAYISKTNKLSVAFPGVPTAGSGDSRTQFLLEYNFVGCPDIPTKSTTEVLRQGDTVEVRCLVTGETWFLTCHENRWTGKLGNCSQSGAEPWVVDGWFQGSESFPFGILVVVAVGVALGIFLGGTLLLVVSVYMKRRRRQQELRVGLQTETCGFHGAVPSDDYYRKQHESTELENKNEFHQEGHINPQDYKMMDYRPPFTPGTYHPASQNTPRNMHHVYESPKFT